VLLQPTCFFHRTHVPKQKGMVRMEYHSQSIAHKKEDEMDWNTEHEEQRRRERRKNRRE